MAAEPRRTTASPLGLVFLPDDGNMPALVPSKKYCQFEGCGKRLTPAMKEMACKCEMVFCGRHRLPEAHPCTFDWKAESDEILRKKLTGTVFRKNYGSSDSPGNNCAY